MIDAHLHFSDPQRLHHAWLDALPPLRRVFTSSWRTRLRNTLELIPRSFGHVRDPAA
jgi:predicted TIM-barrel fold metal-dependent hydrolase